MDIEKWVVCGLLIVAEMGAVMFPLLRYVYVGWRAKRKDIMDGLDTDARLAYFKMFSRTAGFQTAKAASDKFEQLYEQWYGRRFFVWPGMLLFLTALAGSTLVTFSELAARKYIPNPLFDVPATAVAALAGAYLWTVNDLISRSRRLDFSPSDVQWGALRLIIAIPMGYAFASVAASAVGPFVAFSLGAFPLATLSSMLRRVANKQLGLEATPDEASDDIIKLQGINKAIVERLNNEDVATVTQIAYCDPVQLVMRSNLTFNFVTDCMNQALAWMYLEERLDKLRPFGMRGACEIRHLVQDFDDDSPDSARKAEHDRAVAAFPVIAAAVGLDIAALQITFREIAGDPYTEYLAQVWT
jgi:hypothetical protein